MPSSASGHGETKPPSSRFSTTTLLFWFSVVLLVSELIFSLLIIQQVPYTEIDWEAYMCEVGRERTLPVYINGTLQPNQSDHFVGFLGGQWNYSLLAGATGPCVYPAGFVYVFSLLHNLTDQGHNIQRAQYIFAGLYCLLLAVVFNIYRQTDKANFVSLLLLCLSRRIHSIFMLRLFNDGITMLLLYLSVYLLIRHRWSLGCLVFSLAVSIKMNVLLFAPGLGILLLQQFGIIGTAVQLFLFCFIPQVVLAIPFLIADPHAYLHSAFNFGRVFFHTWTVSFKWVPEDLFVSKQFALTLLVLQLVTLLLFAHFKWCKRGLFSREIFWFGSMKARHPVSANHIVTTLFTSNFVGIVFSRTLHFQFYVWYFHTLPFLLWSIPIGTIARVSTLLSIELIWNIFPSTVTTSLSLTCIHLALLIGLLVALPRADSIKNQ